jgi:hypothetical protein
LNNHEQYGGPLKIRHGKKLDSFQLKQNLNKEQSVANSKQASLAIEPGKIIEQCPLCNSTHRDFLQMIYLFQYVTCGQCGGVYVANPPSNDDLKQLYNSDYYTAANKALLASDNIINFRTTHVAEPKIDYVLDHLTTEKKRWLDIGSGAGEILGTVKSKGFECMGLEANKVEREFAIRTFGVDVRDAFLDENTMEEYKGEWGVISLFSVLEHIPDPVSLLETVSSTQEDGDNLVIEVPHFPSLSGFSQMAFPDHVNRVMHPPLHLFLFSLDSLKRLLKNCGYEINGAWIFGQDFYEILSTLSLFASNLNGSVLHTKISELIGEFQQIIDDKEMCDTLLVVAQKKD